MKTLIVPFSIFYCISSVLIGCKLPIISLLIENGADANLRDQNKMRALDLARLLGSQELIELLEKNTTQEEPPIKEEDVELHQVRQMSTNLMSFESYPK